MHVSQKVPLSRNALHTGNLEEGKLLLRSHVAKILEGWEEQGPLVLVEEQLGLVPVVELHSDTNFPQRLGFVGVQAILDAFDRVVFLRVREGRWCCHDDSVMGVVVIVA